MYSTVRQRDLNAEKEGDKRQLKQALGLKGSDTHTHTHTHIYIYRQTNTDKQASAWEDERMCERQLTELILH